MLNKCLSEIQTLNNAASISGRVSVTDDPESYEADGAFCYVTWCKQFLISCACFYLHRNQLLRECVSILEWPPHLYPTSPVSLSRPEMTRSLLTRRLTRVELFDDRLNFYLEKKWKKGFSSSHDGITESLSTVTDDIIRVVSLVLVRWRPTTDCRSTHYALSSLPLLLIFSIYLLLFISTVIFFISRAWLTAKWSHV